MLVVIVLRAWEIQGVILYRVVVVVGAQQHSQPYVARHSQPLHQENNSTLFSQLFYSRQRQQPLLRLPYSEQPEGATPSLELMLPPPPNGTKPPRAPPRAGGNVKLFQ